MQLYSLTLAILYLSAFVPVRYIHTLPIVMTLEGLLKLDVSSMMFHYWLMSSWSIVLPLSSCFFVLGLSTLGCFFLFSYYILTVKSQSTVCYLKYICSVLSNYISFIPRMLASGLIILYTFKYNYFENAIKII